MKYEFKDIDIYPVTGRNLYGDRSDTDVITALANGGAKIVQLRDKSLSALDYYELALLYRIETKRHGMLLIINDRLDIAVAVGADGLHLGRNDLPIAVARTVAGPEMIIGASSHSLEQALQAEQEGATYVNVGPIYPTPTKPGVVAIGLGPLKQSVAAVKIPVSTMGGVTADTIDDVLATGVRHVGVVSAIFAAKDIAEATATFAAHIRRGAAV